MTTSDTSHQGDNKNSPPPGALFATADICDANPAAQVCNLPFRTFGGVANFSGRCATAAATGSPRAVVQLLSEPGEGRILVIDGSAVPEFACLGELVAKRALSNGWVGFVINGAIRDTAALAELPVGVRALGTTARRPSGEGPAAECGVELSFGGATFRPGCLIYVDADAVLVLPE